MRADYPLLDLIESPADLRGLPESRLPTLAEELREFIVHSISTTGGHFAASLGAIELTVALHYVFDTPDDRIVWDVGHQAYAHKILTGRRQGMPSLRQKDGLSGFPKRSESPYDTFGVGHSSTSIGAATGMAIAGHLQREIHRAIAVIGDGAMTAGMAFEALNHAGDVKADVLVVLNDNEMSISPNVGALNKHLTRLFSGRLYTGMRDGSKQVLRNLPPMMEFARRAESHMKGMVTPSSLFEEMGFNYYGPIDGHDLPGLVHTLENLERMEGPRVLHIITKKGKGYAPAEEDPCTYHGVSKFDPQHGLTKKQGSSPNYTQIFGDWLCDMAEQDPSLVAITPAMREGSGLVSFAERFPDRFFDVGIAEQHALTLAAGMACEGLRPVVAIYSTFLQRAYDQLIHDIAIQKLAVTLAIDRAGIVGPDGATHAGSFDLSYLRCIPELVIMAPATEDECRQMLYTAYQHPGPVAVRYPRDTGPGTAIQAAMTSLPLGKGEVLRQGEQIALLVFGSLLPPAQAAAERLNATVVNMRFVKPLDTDLLDELASNHRLLVTLEDNAARGGAGSGVNEYLVQRSEIPVIINLGLPDRFLDHGKRTELLAEAGLDAESIYQTAAAKLAALTD